MSELGKPEIGKLYKFKDGLTILCTSNEQVSNKRFEGVVVDGAHKYSDHQKGNYSKTWTYVEGMIEKLDNKYSIFISNAEERSENCGDCSNG